MQSAGMLPADPLPWNPSNQPLSLEAQLRANRMSDEFSFNLGEGVAPSALISSAELETGGTRRSGDIKQTMQSIDMPAQMSAKDQQRMSDMYDMGRLSDQFNRLSAEFEWGAPSDSSPTTAQLQPQHPVGVEPAESVPPEFLGMEMDPDRISDPRISDRCSSMDPQVLNTLIQHSEDVRQKAAMQQPRQAAGIPDGIGLRRTSSELMWEIMEDLDGNRKPSDL
eukprot:TRINITY_DN11757_c0_g2_i2.p1 TRINITY_DN11757_c0_g2~~TRINITY_DN11757_c0_g2_i2.p1  ORF type:complete len:223 (-),score=25.60 TRINITY_DN11757_c0_g2_i2:226-894(-)